MTPFPMTDEERARRKAQQYARFARERDDEARFLKDIAEHEMQVIMDNGVHRHIRFKKPGTMCMYFDLITYPGGLLYTGDMGTYVFVRLQDMFEFFRTSPQDSWVKEMGLTLYTNHSYWSEKLVATDCSGRRGGKAEEFCEEKFKQVVIESYLRPWIKRAREDGTLDKEQRRELWEEVHTEIIDRISDYGEGIIQKCYEFSWKPHLSFNESLSRKAKSYHFEDFFEHSFTTYTHSFRWCCMALSWGIAKYDAWKDEQAKAAAKKDAFDSLPDDYEVN